MKTYKILIFLILLNSFFIKNLYAFNDKTNKFIQTTLISYENDSIYKKDRYYSNGLQLLFITRENELKTTNKFLSSIFQIKNINSYNFSFGLGQKIYTPNDIKLSYKIDVDRPYAGYLYGFLNKNITFNKNTTDTFGISIGLTGPNSLAENVQEGIHKLIGSPAPQGWNHQLENELLFMISWMKTININYSEKNDYGWKIIPRFITNIGTPITNFNPTIEFRFGWNLDNDLISNKIQTTSLGIKKNGKNFEGISYYAFLESGLNFVGYDTFIDGNISGYKPNIEKNWFRYEIIFGLTLRLNNFYIKFSNNLLSKEFKEQKNPQLIVLLSGGYLF